MTVILLALAALVTIAHFHLVFLASIFLWSAIMWFVFEMIPDPPAIRWDDDE